MKQKLIKIGNSVGFILPKHIQQEMGLKLRDSVAMKIPHGDSLVISPEKKEKKSHGVNAKFMNMVDEFLTEHKDVLEKLAKR